MYKKDRQTAVFLVHVAGTGIAPVPPGSLILHVSVKEWTIPRSTRDLPIIVSEPSVRIVRRAWMLIVESHTFSNIRIYPLGLCCSGMCLTSFQQFREFFHSMLPCWVTLSYEPGEVLLLHPAIASSNTLSLSEHVCNCTCTHVSMSHACKYWYNISMANVTARTKARALRRSGVSIRDISRQLQQPKSTVSYWCRGIVLSKKQIVQLHAKQGSVGTKALLHHAETQRAARKQREGLEAREGAALLGGVGKRDLLFLGIGLYWGEGYKYEGCEFGFTNSDPDMMRVYVRWLYNVFEVPSNSLVCRVSVNDMHADRVAEIEKYWQLVTDLPPEQFTQTSLIHTVRKKRCEDKTPHYGTLRIKVKSGTSLRNRVLGAIQALGEMDRYVYAS